MTAIDDITKVLKVIDSRIKAIIFDLDDTLYLEKDYVKSGYKAVADYLGEETATEELWSYFTEGKAAIDEYLNKISRQEEKQKCLDVYRNHFPDIKLKDEVRSMITDLTKRGKKLGIITDGRVEGQKNKLEALGIYDIIDKEYIIITDELGGIQFRKPCDIAFRIMATKMRLNYEEMIYIGDNKNKDFAAPNRLGMKAVYFKNKDGLYI